MPPAARPPDLRPHDAFGTSTRSATTGTTALHVASSAGSVKCVRVLLSYGADPNAVVTDTTTTKERGMITRWAERETRTSALSAPIGGGPEARAEIVRLLEKHGAKPIRETSDRRWDNRGDGMEEEAEYYDGGVWEGGDGGW